MQYEQKLIPIISKFQISLIFSVFLELKTKISAEAAISSRYELRTL